MNNLAAAHMTAPAPLTSARHFTTPLHSEDASAPSAPSPQLLITLNLRATSVQINTTDDPPTSRGEGKGVGESGY